MVAGARVVLVAALAFAGCRSAHEVAVDSYRTATAPVNAGAQPSVNSGTAATTTTTTTTASPESPQVSTFTETNRPLPTPKSISSAPETTTSAPASISSARSSSAELNFPTAKPVEGKPGYVYSPFDPGKYVDVSGYAPGSKVKDPYSGKIFLVP